MKFEEYDKSMVRNFRNMKRQHKNEPTHARYYIENDNIQLYWTREKGGKLYRDNGPAFMAFDKDNKLTATGWFIHDDKPLPASEVEDWLKENDLTYPLDDEGVVALKLRWL